MEFDINLYDPVTEYDEKEKREVSLKQLRTVLKDRFDQSSALDGIRAQLRKQVLSKLLGKENEKHGLHSTLSVFAAESGMESERNILSELDISRMLKFNELSSLFNDLQNFAAGESDSVEYPVIAELVYQERSSLLDLILEYCLSLRAELTREISVQAGSSTFTARELLDHQLIHLEKHYSERNESIVSNEGKSFEERMIMFQKEMEERKNREVEIQVRYFRENEASKIRTEEASKARAAMEAMRQDLEFDYSQRMKGHLEREQECMRRAKEQERLAQINSYEARQQMEREMEEIRARESILSRKVDLESQGLKLLEIRLKEAQLMLEQREREARKLEEDANQKLQQSMELARKEMSLRMQKEFEELNALRYEVTLEKRKLDEEKLTVFVDKEGNRLLRNEMNKLRELLATREGENSMLKWSLSQAQQQQQNNFTHVIQQPMRYLEEELETPATPNLPRQPSESNFQFDRLSSENNHLRNEVEQMRARLEDAEKLSAANQSLSREIENLKTDLRYEKARALGREHKIEELQRLVQEKTQTIDSLSRQLDAQVRREQQLGPNPLHPKASFASLTQQYAQHPALAGLLGRLLPDEVYERSMLQGLRSTPTVNTPSAQRNFAPPPTISLGEGLSSAYLYPLQATSLQSLVPPAAAVSPQSIAPVLAPVKPVSSITYQASPPSPVNPVTASSSGILHKERATFCDPDEARRRNEAEHALHRREEDERRRRIAIDDELQRLKEQEIARLKRSAQEAEDERARVLAARAREEVRLQEQQAAATARRKEMERNFAIPRIHQYDKFVGLDDDSMVAAKPKESKETLQDVSLAPTVAVTQVNDNGHATDATDAESQRKEREGVEEEEYAKERERQRQRAEERERLRVQRLQEEAEEDARERKREEDRRMARERDRQELLRREQEERDEEEKAATERERLREEDRQRKLLRQQQENYERIRQEEQDRQDKERERQRNMEYLAEEKKKSDALRAEQEQLYRESAAAEAAERLRTQSAEAERATQERQRKQAQEEAEEAKRRQEEDEIADARKRVLERRKQKAAADAGLTASTESLRSSWNNPIGSSAATFSVSVDPVATVPAVAVRKPASNRPVFDFAEESDSKIEFDANSDDSTGAPDW